MEHLTSTLLDETYLFAIIILFYLWIHSRGRQETSDEVDRNNNQESEGESEVNLVNNQNVSHDPITPPSRKGSLISDPVDKSLPEKDLYGGSCDCIEDPHESDTSDASASDTQSGWSQNDVSYESDKDQGSSLSSDAILSLPVSSQNDTSSADAPDDTTHERGEDEGHDDAVTPVSDQNDMPSKDAPGDTTHESSKGEGPADDAVTPPVDDRYDIPSVAVSSSEESDISSYEGSPEHKFIYSIEETSYDKNRSSPVIDPVLLTKFDRNSELVCPPLLANWLGFQLKNSIVLRLNWSCFSVPTPHVSSEQHPCTFEHYYSFSFVISTGYHDSFSFCNQHRLSRQFLFPGPKQAITIVSLSRTKTGYHDSFSFYDQNRLSWQF